MASPTSWQEVVFPSPSSRFQFLMRTLAKDTTSLSEQCLRTPLTATPILVVCEERVKGADLQKAAAPAQLSFPSNLDLSRVLAQLPAEDITSIIYPRTRP